MEKNPFDGYHIKQQVFGDPIFLTKEEIHALYAKDFSKNPKMDSTKRYLRLPM